MAMGYGAAENLRRGAHAYKWFIITFLIGVGINAIGMAIILPMSMEMTRSAAVQAPGQPAAYTPQQMQLAAAKMNIISGIMTFIWLPFYIWMHVCIYNLTSAMGYENPWLWNVGFVLGCVPCLALILLIVLVTKANAWFRDQDVAVGFMGPNQQSVDAAIRNMQTRPAPARRPPSGPDGIVGSRPQDPPRISAPTPVRKPATPSEPRDVTPPQAAPGSPEEYVLKSRSKGMTDDEIVSTLTARGWSEEQARELVRHTW